MSDLTILVVDDEEDILELVSYNLEREGVRTRCVSSGEKAIEAARNGSPDLIVLDLMLPGVGGLDVCRALKSDPATRSIPVVMLTARGEESDIVKGLELGADDYVTKPFSPRVLVARIRAVLRRKETEVPADDAVIEIGELSIHPRRHDVLARGRPVQLTHAEFSALCFLARRPGWVFTRQQIVKAIHGRDYVVTDRSVDVMIVGLRKKLGDSGEIIETVRGVGYRMKG